MMGQLAADQNALFYDFNLEQRIPDNHLLRKIDQFLDFDQIRSHLHSFYSHIGRPFDRSRVNDSDATGWLLLRHSF